MRPRHAHTWLAFASAAVLPALLAQPVSGAGGIYREQWALLVGVGAFRSAAIPPLSFCRDDVEAMRELLVSRTAFRPDHVVTLLDEQATRQGILHELGRLADRGRVSEEDAVLVYFSGHGQTVPMPRGGEMGFLVPHDAAIDPTDSTNPSDYYQTCLGMDEVRRLSGLIPARHVLFLFDACYSGLAVQATRGAPPGTALATVAARPVRQIIVAGLKDEKAQESPAWGHGAFTHSLLDGLDTGNADLNRDGFATGMELATYLRGEVPRLAPQTPQYAAFDGDGEFIFALGGASGAAAPSPAPRFILNAPRDLVEGCDEVAVRPLGDEVVVSGVVVGPEPVVEISVDGAPVNARPVQAAGLWGLEAGEDCAAAFTLTVSVAQGESRPVALRARDAAGGTATRRLVMQARAPDDQPPEVYIAEVRTYDDRGQEADWRALTMASKALTMASKDVVLAGKPGQRHTLFGIARDDRAVVGVTVGGYPVPTRPATAAELAATGWPYGVAFEGAVTSCADGTTLVEARARDAAGHEGQASITVRLAGARAPRIVIREPRVERGTVLKTPTALERMEVAGYVLGEAPITRVTVDGLEARLRPASAQELAELNLQPPGSYFSIEVGVAPTGTTHGVMVEAIDSYGARATKEVLVQRPGPPLRPEVHADRVEGYRVGERVHLYMTCPRDSYVYLYHLEPDGSFAQFLPNPVEPDNLLAGGVPRLFPNPMEEARWQGEYGLVAQEPTGTDTVYLLAIPRPLVTQARRDINSADALIRALRAMAGPTARDVAPALSPDDQVASLAEDVGGTWQRVNYEVRP